MPEPDQRIEMIGLNRPRNPIVMMITVNVYMIRIYPASVQQRIHRRWQR
ncbi:hypothetical protein KR49_02440 [Synechococcus sp. KORDI-49]|jgi:hypothetical protein|nr:hypothetical protein KR49_02440 [Synechococcus sp. KORDI-49]